MRFPAPLIPATLIQRYKRFLADVRLDDGRVLTVTCPNTGSMHGLTTPGARIWISHSSSPTRKYAHTWELVETDLGAGPVLVGINTMLPNRIVTEALTAGLIPSLAGYPELKREQKYGRNSRIDILLSHPARGRCYVEIKNVHMARRSGLAEFPDSVTERGTRHLGELADMVRQGHRAMMVYLIQRGDPETFSLARDVDPAYGLAFDAAVAAGIEALALTCRIGPDGIEIADTIPITDLPARRSAGSKTRRRRAS